MDKSYIIDYLNDNFEYRVLKRGFDYYRDDRIDEAKMIDSNTYIFYVEGTDLYQVEINLENDKIKEIDCSCPYAQSAYCKHMAATLFYLGENDVEIYEDDDVDNKDFRSFKRRIQGQLGSLGNDYDNYDYNDEFYGYDDTFDNELIEIISSALNEVKGMIAREDYKLAVECILFLYEAIENIDAYILDGISVCRMLIDKEFAKIVNKEIDLIIDKLGESAMFDRYYNNDYLDIIADNLDNEEDAMKLYTFMDNIEVLSSRLSNSYMSSKAPVIKLKLSLRYFPAKIDRILEDNAENYDIFIVYLKYLMKNNDIDKIKDFVRYLYRFTVHQRSEIKSMLRDYDNNEFFEKNVEIYLDKFKAFPNKRTYKELLENLTKDELKQYDEEIEQIILGRSFNFELYKKYCLDHNKLRNLFSEASKSLDNLIRNYELFKVDYSSEMLENLINLMKKEIDDSKSRKQYQKIVSYIIIISKYENSESVINEIIDYIRSNYSKRSALIDEIDFFELMNKRK